MHDLRRQYETMTVAEQCEFWMELEKLLMYRDRAPDELPDPIWFARKIADIFERNGYTVLTYS